VIAEYIAISSRFFATWVDPKEELVAVYMSQAPSTARAYYRKLVKQLVYAAIVN
jgi:hypothetical protein